MSIFGLEPAAQVVALQGLSTYGALASAYFYARPVLRGQTIAANRDLLANLQSRDAATDRLVQAAKTLLDERIRAEQPAARRDNRLGTFLLLVSFLCFTGALLRQIETDPLFRSPKVEGATLR